MSMPVLPETRVQLERSLAVRARLAAAGARVLVAFPPRTIERVLVRVVRGAARAEAGDVLHWRNAVNTVSRRCAGIGCLQRSVAVMLLARSFGVAPTWRTGFRTSPFAAHAWVEVAGEPVGEPPGIDHFRSMITVNARPDHPA